MAVRSLQLLNKDNLGLCLSRGFVDKVSKFPRSQFTVSNDLHYFTDVGSGGRWCRFQSLTSNFQSLKTRVKDLSRTLNTKLSVLSLLFARQCHALAAQRARRALQISLLYHRLGYDKQALKKAFESLGRGFMQRKNPLFVLFGATAFQWESNSISDDKLQEVADEIVHLQKPSKGHENDPTTVDEHYMDAWEQVINRDHIKLWRRPIPNSYLYEYKVFGTYNDLPAQAFYQAQLDTEFRKQWDKLVIKLDVIDRDEASSQEVVQWIMHFPFPMYAREYIYLRRTLVNEKKRVFVIYAESVDHPSCPRQDKYVRVETYVSCMVIRAHSKPDENGFDYILTYYDEPKAPIPSAAYKWMANTGVPDFVDKVHNAAKELHQKKKSFRREDPCLHDTQTSSIPM